MTDTTDQQEPSDDAIAEIASDLIEALADMNGTMDVREVQRDERSATFGFTRNGVGYSLMVNVTP